MINNSLVSYFRCEIFRARMKKSLCFGMNVKSHIEKPRETKKKALTLIIQRICAENEQSDRKTMWKEP